MTPEPRTVLPARNDAYVPPAEARWGFIQVAAGLGLFILVLVGANLLVATGVIAGSDVAQFVLSIAGYGVLLGTVVYASRRRGPRSLARDFWLRFRPVDLAIGVGIALLGKVIGVVWGILGIALFGVPRQQSNLSLSGDTLWLVLNGIVMVAIVAPFVEELFVRGLVMQSIRNAVLRRAGRGGVGSRSAQGLAVFAAIGGSALLFMALHLYQSPEPALLFVLGGQTLTLGVLNGLSVFITQRLGPAIVAHMVFNGISVATLLLVSAAG